MANASKESTQPIPTNLEDLKKLIKEVIEQERKNEKRKKGYINSSMG